MSCKEAHPSIAVISSPPGGAIKYRCNFQPSSYCPPCPPHPLLQVAAGLPPHAAGQPQLQHRRAGQHRERAEGGGEPAGGGALLARESGGGQGGARECGGGGGGEGQDGPGQAGLGEGPVGPG